jgi:hypothetical protein
VVLGGLCLIAGYASAWLAREKSAVPQGLRDFHRREQLARLRQLVTRRGSMTRPNNTPITSR